MNAVTTRYSTVYVPQTSDKNLGPAEKFGPLNIICGTGNEKNLTTALHKIKSELAGITESDFLLPIGSPVLVGLATAIAARRLGGKLKLLTWDASTGFYREEMVVL